jgi:hypothetical protein
MIEVETRNYRAKFIINYQQLEILSMLYHINLYITNLFNIIKISLFTIQFIILMKITSIKFLEKTIQIQSRQQINTKIKI